MLKCFKVKNYKNFQDTIVFDFGNVGGYQFNRECLSENYIGKAIVYGRNATGKTNLGEAIIDIRSVFSGRSLRLRNQKITNADSNEKEAKFFYEFVFDEDNVKYSYLRNDECVVVEEKLEINNQIVFEYDSRVKKFREINLNYVNAESLQIDNFLIAEDDSVDPGEVEYDDGFKIPFLRYLIANSALDTSSALIKLKEYVLRMRMSSVTEQINTRSVLPRIRFFELIQDKDNVEDFEDFLKAMGVECSLILEDTVEGKKELFFNYKTPLSFFDNASSGTISLTSLYVRYVALLKNPSFIYMDEFDAFYHYEMSEKWIKYIKNKYPKTQIILTTHNTNLMNNSIMRPDCLFILSRNGYLTPICDATERELREGHNLEKLYIAGEFQKYE